MEAKIVELLGEIQKEIKETRDLFNTRFDRLDKRLDNVEGSLDTIKSTLRSTLTELDRQNKS